MEVADFHPVFAEIFGEVFGHALGQHRDQHAAAGGGGQAAFGEQVIDLAFDRADVGDRIDQSGWADHLFGEHAMHPFEFPRAGGGADEQRLRAEALPFLKFQRAVIHAARQAESEF